MPAKAPLLFPKSVRELAALGERLRLARLRRRFSAQTVSARADISRQTLSKIETGDAAVTLGNYMQVLRVLGMEQDLALLAADDVLGRRLQDAQLPQPRSAPRRRQAPAPAPALLAETSPKI